MKASLSILLMLLPFFGISQQFKRQTIGSLGGTHSGGGLIVTYTAGETRVLSKNPSFYNTEGFQQGDLSGLVNLEERMFTEGSIHLFPNPARNQLNLQIESFPTEGISVEVIDALGRSIALPTQQDSSSESAQFKIEVSSLSAGIYFLVVRSRDGEIRKSLKFQKVL